MKFENHDIQQTMQSYPLEIRKYVADLFRRRGDAVVLPRAKWPDIEWQPKPNECHDNVDRICRCNTAYGAVRGWLYFDFSLSLGHVRFLQHSVLKFPDGKVYDITPPHENLSRDYPFISVEESDEDFFEKEKYAEDGNLYFPLSPHSQSDSGIPTL